MKSTGDSLWQQLNTETQMLERVRGNYFSIKFQGCLGSRA